MEVISSIYNSGYNIKKFYLGSRELNLAYLGNQVIYDEVIGDNDLNYILYEFYGSDTLPNTVEAPVKSAILKGQTVVNLARNFKYQIGWKYDWGGETENAQRCSYNVESAKGNTKYLIKNFNESTQAYIRYYSNSSNAPLSESGWLDLPAIITTPTNTAKFAVSLRISDNNEEYISPDQANKNLVVECQGDVENYDIPYGELVSVKLPVLTTFNGFEIFKTGMTLDEFDYNLVSLNNGCIHIPHSSSAYIKTKKEYTLLPNQSYVVRVVGVSGYNNSVYGIRLAIGDRQLMQVTEPFLIEELSKNSYCDVVYTNTTGKPITGVIRVFSYFGDYKIDKIYIGEEPFKSNILTTSEEVELRGIGRVQDELNCLTGEVTQRIVEIVLDGSEDWLAEDHRFTLKGVENLLEGKWSLLISDKYSSYSFLDYAAQYDSYIMGNGWSQSFSIRDVALFPDPKNQLSEFKEYLSQNPVTVQYQSATESIKAVDLTIVDQDGKTINKLNSFNGTTHVSTEVAENSAYPMVSLEVASELQAAMSKVAEDIELIKPVQNDIETTIDTQSNDIDSLLLATTELFEMFL